MERKSKDVTKSRAEEEGGNKPTRDSDEESRSSAPLQ